MFNFFSGLFYLSVFCFICFLVLLFIFFVVGAFRVRIKRGKRPRSSERKVKIPSAFRRIFIDFPFTYFSDLWDRSRSDLFPYHGLWLFVGEQGSGKTTTMSYILNHLHKKYPKCRCYSNYAFADLPDITDPFSLSYLLDDSPVGTVFAVDEVQNWFSCDQSKGFPPEFLAFFAQLRKAYCVTMGTSQVFSRVSKPLREQVKLVFCPHTFFGCLTVCGVYRPDLLNSGDGSVIKLRLVKRFFFVQSAELRECFDTRLKIQHKSITRKDVS